jgi:hypothetical protein
MALEAINLHTDICMTTRAKVIFFLIRVMHRRAICTCGRNMAINAFFQAMLGCAYALNHGFITMHIEISHVILANIRRRLDTLSGFSFGRR